MPRHIPILLSTLLLASCTHLQDGRAFDSVADRARQLTGQSPQWQQSANQKAAVQQRMSTLLQKPLTADTAVTIGLLNNRALQARFEQLAIVAGRGNDSLAMPNPVLSAGRRQGGGASTLDAGIEFDISSLIWHTPIKRLAESELRRVQADATQAVIEAALQLRTAFYQWQAAEQQLDMLRTVEKNTRATSELANRQVKAGTLDERNRARQQLLQAEAGIAVTRAETEAATAREQLNRLMALDASQQYWKADCRLPEPPQALGAVNHNAALQQPALQAAREDLAYYAEALQLTQHSRYLALIGLGSSYERASGEAAQIGPTLQLELPLFNHGGARVQQQAAMYRQAEQRLYQLTVDTASQTRDAETRWRNAWQIVQTYRTQLLPLHQHILEETQLRYNGMLDDVYTLLAERREQVSTGAGYIAALRDFWIAQAQLAQLTGQQLTEQQLTEQLATDTSATAGTSDTTGTSAAQAAIPATSTEASEPAGHSHHGSH